MSKQSIIVESQNSDMIHDVQMDYYGKMLATCSSDNRVRIYTIENGASDLLLEIAEHSGPVWKVGWSHPKYGSLLASCSYDGLVRIFRISKDKTYSVEYTYSGHTSSVNCLEWAPQEYGAVLASVSSDGHLAILYRTNEGGWESQEVLVSSMGCSALSWCPYRPNAKDSYRIAVAAGDSCIHIYRCYSSPSNAWNLEVKLRGHTDRVRHLAWCPFIGITTSFIASCGRDRQLIIWSKEDGETWNNVFSHHYSDMIWRVEWSITGNLLVVSHGVGGIDSWKENLDHTWRIVNSYHADV